MPGANDIRSPDPAITAARGTTSVHDSNAAKSRLSGFGMSGADVAVLSVVRAGVVDPAFELGAFQPIDRTTPATPQQPGDLVHGPERKPSVKRYIEERYKLMPYLYAAAEELSRSGLPIVSSSLP